jgi:hypothetical protein
MTRPTIGVCGFGRCGTTMTMAMLIAGGVPTMRGAEEVPYELEDIRLAHVQRDLDGHAVKLLDSALHYGVPPARSWRFVWLDRDPLQQALSQLKLLSGFGVLDGTDSFDDDAVAGWMRSYAADRPRALAVLRRHGPVLVMEYERVLAQPRKAAKQLARLWPGLQVDAAAAVVHRRDGRCLPDLAVEVAGSVARQEAGADAR